MTNKAEFLELLRRETELHEWLNTHPDSLLRRDWLSELEGVCYQIETMKAESRRIQSINGYSYTPAPEVTVDPMLTVLTRIAVALERIADR